MHRIYLVLILAFITVSGVIAQQQNNYAPKDGTGCLWVGAIVGPSLLLEKAADSIMPEIQDYVNKLRSGWHYGFEAEYFFNEYFGVGAKYTSFHTKQEVDSLIVEFFSTIFYIDLSSEMKINSVSPMVYGKVLLLQNKLSVTGGMGPAWLFYRNIGKAIDDSLILKGSSPGFATSLRIGYEVIPNMSVALQGNYTHAFLKEFSQDDGSSQQVITLEKGNYQNISRIDFSFGLFYTFRRK